MLVQKLKVWGKNSRRRSPLRRCSRRTGDGGFRFIDVCSGGVRRAEVREEEFAVTANSLFGERFRGKIVRSGRLFAKS